MTTRWRRIVLRSCTWTVHSN